MFSDGKKMGNFIKLSRKLTKIYKTVFRHQWLFAKAIKRVDSCLEMDILQ